LVLPAGLPHSLQGLGPDGTEFVIAFDKGDSSEFNRLLVTDRLAETLRRIACARSGLWPPALTDQQPPLHPRFAATVYGWRWRSTGGRAEAAKILHPTI
jgi:hypothetical protein